MSGESQRKWSGKTAGGNLGLGFLLSAVGKMPLACSYAMLEIGLPFHLLFSPKLFRATKNFFIRRMGCSRLEAFRKAYSTHRCFGRVMFDRFHLFTKGEGDFNITSEGRSMMLEVISKSHGAVIAGTHVGSMEMAGYIFGLENVPISAIVYGGENAVFQKKRVGQLRPHGVRLIPVSDDLSHLFAAKEALDNGESVTMPCDRILGSSKCESVEFLGAPAKFPIGAFILAAQLEKEMLLLFSMKEGRRGYRVIVKHIEVERSGKSSRQIAEELLHLYVRELEKLVREYPTQWFNFYDFWDEDE